MSYRKVQSNRNNSHRKYNRRRRGIDFRKLGLIAVSTVAVVIVGYMIYSHLPFVKVDKAIAAGDKFTENADYESAIESYSKALEIDSKSVKAYANLAGAYLSIDDSASAKETLYNGWKNTDSSALKDNYHIIILNDAVSAMNNDCADLGTVKSILSVLEDGSDNPDAMELLKAASERCFENAYGDDANALFRSGDDSKPTYSGYSEMIKSMLTLYQASPSDDLKEIILDYLTPNISSFTLNIADVESYKELIASATEAVGTTDEIENFNKCLSNSQEVLSIFSDIFGQLDVGNVDELRGFVVSDQYLALRNVFLNKQETVLENTTYVPISREAIILNNNDGNWSYRFLDFDENPETNGVITLWANFFEDDGVQRASISYEPAAINGNVYPHTQYSVTYLYSYITSGSSTKVAKMNYRLDTTITYEDGTIDETIVGDWGGANEWVMDIDTIESRIKA